MTPSPQLQSPWLCSLEPLTIASSPNVAPQSSDLTPFPECIVHMSLGTAAAV